MHTMELPFVYRNLQAAKTEVGDITPEMAALSDTMSLAWTNFARAGNPNHKGVPNWPAFESQKLAMMIFNTPQSQSGQRSLSRTAVGKTLVHDAAIQAVSGWPAPLATLLAGSIEERTDEATALGLDRTADGGSFCFRDATGVRERAGQNR